MAMDDWPAGRSGARATLPGVVKTGVGKTVVTIRGSILLGFTVMCLLTGGIGYFSLKAITRSSVMVSDIYDHSLAPNDFARAARADFAAMQAGFLRRRMTADAASGAGGGAADGSAARAFFEDLAASADRAASAGSRDEAAAVKRAADAWSNSERSIAAGVPLTRALKLLDEPSASVQRHLDRLIGLQAADGFRYREHALHALETERGLALTLTGTALLLSGLLALVIARRVSGPIAPGSGVAGRMADRDPKEALRCEARLAQSNVWFDAALATMIQGLCVYDSAWRLTILNDRFTEIFRLEPGSVQPGMMAAEVTALLDWQTCDGATGGGDQKVGDGKVGDAAERVRFLADGRAIAVTHRAMSDGGWVLTYEDITERRRSEARASFLTHHDALTSLPNRMLFGERLEAALSELGQPDAPGGLGEGDAQSGLGEGDAQSGLGQSDALSGLGEGGAFGLLLIDLDRFKEVNDTHGHPVGDRLLQIVAERLLACSRRQDTVARLGSDEFAILQAGIEGAQDTQDLAQRVIASIGRKFSVDGAPFDIGASVGIVIAPEHGDAAETLLRHADVALDRAKADGRNDFRVFTPSMDAAMQDRRALESELLRSLAEGQMQVFYQPIVSVRDAGAGRAGSVSGFEALVRWNHPIRGLLMPGEFIPLAEDTGFIERLGGWVLAQACSDAAGWPAHIKLAVNVSPVQFRSGKLVQLLAESLARTSLEASRLDLEITETALLAENDATLAMLRDMHAMGAKIVLDDFGTGFSSLSYLRSFPFDRIKIDRSFVQDLGLREDSSAIIRAIMALGRSLDLPVTAEGVETGEQFELLRAECCDEAQGYLFSRPVDVSRIAGLLAAGSLSQAGGVSRHGRQA